MKINQFHGIAPIIDSKKLPIGMAQTAENCDLRSGNLKAMAGNSVALALSTGTSWLTVFKFSAKYLYWNALVSAVEGPPVGTDRRVFYTGDGAPKQLLYSEKTGNGKPTVSEYRELGVDAPNVRPDIDIYLAWGQFPDWVEDNDYQIGDFVKQPTSTIYMKCKSDHTSPAAFDISTEYGSSLVWTYFATYWQGTGDTSGAAAYQASHAYTAGDIIIVTYTLPYKCKLSHRATTTNEPGIGTDWGQYWEFTYRGDYIETVSYVFTYVTDLGEESAPSLPTPNFDMYQHEAVKVSGFEDSKEVGTVTVAGGALSTVSGSGTKFTDRFSSGDWILVGDFSAGTAELRVVDTVTDDTTLSVAQAFDAAHSAGSHFSMFPSNLAYIRVYRLTTSEYGAEYQYVPFYFFPTTWASGKYYYADNYVKKGSSAPYTIYKCILANTSAAASEPGVGGSWETYWELTDNTAFVENQNGMPVSAWPYEYWDANLESDLSDIVWPYTINTSLGEVITTEKMIPPASGLSNIIKVSSNVLAAFKDNEEWFSEPTMPYAWPQKYMMKMGGTIIAHGLYGQSIIVMTKVGLTVLTGTPGAMSQRDVLTPQTCVASRGLVSTERGIFYPSSDGLCLVTDTGIPQILTSKRFTKEQWIALSPSTFVSAWFDNKYIAASSSSNVIYVFDFSFGDTVSLEVTTIALATGTTVKSVYVDLENDYLYLLTALAGDYNVMLFKGGSALTMTWKSGKAQLEVPVNPSVARILGTQSTGTPISFSLWADGTLKVDARSISDENIFLLPIGYRAKSFEVQIAGKADVHEIFVGNDTEELNA